MPVISLNKIILSKYGVSFIRLYLFVSTEHKNKHKHKQQNLKSSTFGTEKCLNQYRHQDLEFIDKSTSMKTSRDLSNKYLSPLEIPKIHTSTTII
jgi:hypothetical protein